MSTLTLTPKTRAAQPAPARGGWLTAVTETVSDALTMTGRSVRLSTRDLDAMITAVVLPVMILAMFVLVFGGAIDVGVDYVTYATPGIILLCAGFGAANTALQVEQDMSGGMVDRLRSLPMRSWTVLLGHVGASLIKNLVTTAVVFGFAVLFGFRPTASFGGWLGAVGMLMLFVLAISWAAAFIGVLARSADTAGAFSFVSMFLPYISSAFVPVETMPGWLQGFARYQPATPLIETVRGLLVPGTPGAVSGYELGSTALLATAWTVGLSVLFAVLAAWAYRRRR